MRGKDFFRKFILPMQEKKKSYKKKFHKKRHAPPPSQTKKNVQKIILIASRCKKISLFIIFNM